MPEITLPYNYHPRGYQNPAWQYHMSGGDRSVLVWHRRAGKDLFGINLITYKAHQRVGLYWHMFPTYSQGRKVIWEGFRKDGTRFLDAFPPDIVHSTHTQDMRITLKCGSTYQVVGTDNINRLVGANPIGIVFSEYSLADPNAWNFVRPILAENEGWASFIYTPRGRNHGYKLKELAKKNKRWFCETLRVDQTMAVREEDIQEERDMGMPEELIQQEFYCSFDAPLVGAYYSQAMQEADKENRICSVPYDKGYPVHTAWDIGVNDTNSIIFYQATGLELRIVDYYGGTDAGIQHYAGVLRDKQDTEGYVYGTHYAPWDIVQRDWSANGRSRDEVAKEHGVNFTPVQKSPINEGIDAARRLLKVCWFDGEKCEYLISALREYQKSWDEEKKVYMNKPLHNWASHPADAFRTLAMGHGQPRGRNYGTAQPGMTQQQLSEGAQDDYDPFNYI